MIRRMPPQIDWLLPGRVLYTELLGEFGLDEFQNLYLSIGRDFLVDARPPSVHLLFNLDQLETTTLRIDEVLANLSPCMDSPEFRRKLSGWRVYFGNDDPTFRRITSLLHEAYNQSYVWLPDEQAAINFLMSVDDTLPDLNDGL